MCKIVITIFTVFLLPLSNKMSKVNLGTCQLESLVSVSGQINFP